MIFKILKRQGNEKILGLDLGTNSIGFALNEIEEKDGITIFNELAANSVIFSEYMNAEERRNFRRGRRRNERTSRRKENTRKLLASFNIATKDILENPIDYFNNLTKLYKEPYTLREEAIKGKELSKDEFTFSLYTIISRRGYSNLFATQDMEVVTNEFIFNIINKYNFMLDEDLENKGNTKNNIKRNVVNVLKLSKIIINKKNPYQITKIIDKKYKMNARTKVESISNILNGISRITSVSEEERNLIYKIFNFSN